MRHKYVICLFLASYLFTGSSFAFEYKVITPKELKKKTQGSCVFVQFWAAWCQICVDEMPGLLPFLKRLKKAEPVVVDLSQGLAQENFSKPWLKKIAPFSTTFSKGKTRDREMIESVLQKWNGALPLSALFSRGQLKERWNGAVSNSEIERAVSTHCK